MFESERFRHALRNLNLLHYPLNIKFTQNSDTILTDLAATEDVSSRPLHQYKLWVQTVSQTGRVSWGV